MSIFRGITPRVHEMFQDQEVGAKILIAIAE
jgi:hypothetical protein